MAAEQPVNHDPSAPEGAAPPCSDVSSRESAYLLALHELNAGDRAPTQVELARAMGVSPPTALEMVRRLRRLELIESDRLALTKDGTSAALLLASRRHAAHLLTSEVLGLDARDAQPEAVKLAPNLSPALTRQLMANRRSRS